MTITLTENSPGRLSFSWSFSSHKCMSQSYDVLSSHCGHCPTTTTHTSLTCTNVPKDGGKCAFAVRSVFCGNITGEWSEILNITVFKGIKLVIISFYMLYYTLLLFSCNYNLLTEKTTATTTVTSNFVNDNINIIVSTVTSATSAIMMLSLICLAVFILIWCYKCKQRTTRELTPPTSTNDESGKQYNTLGQSLNTLELNNACYAPNEMFQLYSNIFTQRELKEIEMSTCRDSTEHIYEKLN